MSHREFVAFLATMSVTIAMAIDVMLPALGEMKASFGLPPDSNSIALTVTLYFVGMSAAQLFYGPLADHYGRRLVLYLGLAIYLVGAAGSALAPSLGVLLVSRFVWGVGAAAMRVLSNTLPRDVFDGDRMARVMSLVMTVFLLGPIVAPLIGQGLLQFASWRFVFGAGAVSAVVVVIWSFRLEETLDPINKLPLGFTRITGAIRAVLATRQTRWYAIAQIFIYGNLLMFLASSELLFDVVYGRSEIFAVAFSAAGALGAAVAYTNARVVERFGAGRMMMVGAIASVSLSATLAVVALAGDGAPSFWLWWALVAVLSSMFAILIPTSNALAMQPMGHLAGTAAAVVGTFAMGGGSLLGAVIDRTLSDSVTPQTVAFLAFSLATVVCVRLAHRPALVGAPVA
ncbi:MAG: MFS transporter [Acidimicrobiia bacterium]|nr:MFS transporter [Acidimicrobiia bacterium]